MILVAFVLFDDLPGAVVTFVAFVTFVRFVVAIRLVVDLPYMLLFVVRCNVVMARVPILIVVPRWLFVVWFHVLH